MVLIKCGECGSQVSDKAQACPACGAPVREGVVTPLGETITASISEARQEAEAKTKKTGCFGCLGCLGLLGLGLVIAIASTTVPKGGGDSDKTPKSSPTDNSSMAVVQCRGFVKDRLRSPSTANFTWLDHSVRREGNTTYVVKSYVDAQNGFGATVRSDYLCKIKFIGGNSADQLNWALLDLSISTR